MKGTRRTTLALALAVSAIAATAARAETKDPSIAAIEEYRKMLGDENPAELYEARGAELWKTKRGPKNATLEKCDLGLGPGVVKGAYAVTPRYYPDAGRVLDIESRIVWCMMTEQGFSEADVRKRPFGSADKPSDIEDLVTYVVSASKGMRIKVPASDPKVQEAYELGKILFNYRAGPYDFSCASCHGEDGKRIRLQDLPNLTKKADAQRGYMGWPAYRVSTSRVHSMQWRINDCYRQQRFPEPVYMSEAVNALITYMAVTGNGGVYQGPTLKR